MHRRLSFFVALVAGILLQVTVAPELTIWGVKPDFLLAMTVCVALLEGPVNGAFFGFASGFLADIFSTSLLGVTALAKTAMGFLTGTFQSRVISRSVLWPALLCWAASIFHEIIKFLAWKIVGAEGTPPFLFLSVLWLATYNMLLVLAVYPLLKRILPEREEALVMFNR